MNTEKAIDKIRKLLALAKSDNPGEAENALLFARKLMVKHKLTERDVADAKKPGKLNHRIYEKDTYSPLRNAWMIDLSNVIAEAHCCAASARNRQGSTVFRVQFTGLGDDPEIALTLFDYAVHHILHMTTIYRKNEIGWVTDRHWKNQLARSYQHSYAEGFCRGLAQKYREQFTDEFGQTTETALVMVKPKEVKDFTNGLSSRNLNARRERRNDEALARGYQAGYNFDPTKQIGGMTI